MNNDHIHLNHQHQILKLKQKPIFFFFLISKTKTKYQIIHTILIQNHTQNRVQVMIHVQVQYGMSLIKKKRFNMAFQIAFKVINTLSGNVPMPRIQD